VHIRLSSIAYGVISLTKTGNNSQGSVDIYIPFKTCICSGWLAGGIPTMPPAGNLFNYSIW